MKAVIFNGAPQGHHALEQAESHLLKELSRLKWDALTIPLHKLKFSSCKGCFHCWFNTPGLCRVKDDAVSLSQYLVECDLLALLTPITFGGYGSLLKSALDRIAPPHLLPFMQPRWGEIHHPPRYEKRFRLFAIGSLPKEDPPTEDIFQTVVRRNAMHLASATYASDFVYDYMSPRQIEQRVKNLAWKVETAA